ncbi:MAG: site-specific DNA-methyltransferase [Ruminococcus sp.]|nr:site-specific DNA-methyltransferase [Ruminococcus sp.]
MHTPNKADENFAKLAAMFPNAVTETINENGEVVRAIDKDVLMQEISTTVVEGKDERYQFTWPDKKKAVLAANSPIAKTLRPCREESVDFDNTENLYIEGDNLDVLKLLQETYLGKVKMIYIDPPYNTGNDFVYNDDFAENTEDYLDRSGQFDEEGNRLVLNTESNGRFHTDWLNMIYPRLKLAKDLLSDDGVIFISIDDNEAANLIKVCSEIFGAECFVADIAWQRTYSKRNDSKGIAVEKEHIIVYSKQLGWNPKRLPRTDEMDEHYGSLDGDPRLWASVTINAPGAATHQGMVYAIQHPITGEYLYPPQGRCWSLGQSQMFTYMNEWAEYELKPIDDYEKRCELCGKTEGVPSSLPAIVLKNLISAKKQAKTRYERGENKEQPWPVLYFTGHGLGGIRRKQYLDQSAGRVPTNLWSHSEVGHTGEAATELAELFNNKAPFDTPKPVRLIDRILSISTDTDDLIIDFFSGSATTAHAVMKKNAEDNGNRKYILVQLEEESKSPNYANLCEIGKERIRRAGAKIKEENPMTTAGLDTGFRVLKLDSTNMKDVYYNPDELTIETLMGTVDNIKEDRTPEDLLFQVMLDLGVLLSSKVEQTVIGGKTVYKVADGFLIACFDENVTEETITAVAKMKPYYFVMRDSSMASDSVAANFDQIFEAYSKDTVRKVL